MGRNPLRKINSIVLNDEISFQLSGTSLNRIERRFRKMISQKEKVKLRQEVMDLFEDRDIPFKEALEILKEVVALAETTIFLVQNA